MDLNAIIPPDAEERVTVPQLARWLGCSQQTIHRWIDKGVLPQPFRMGKIIRWDREELREHFRKAALMNEQAARASNSQAAG